ncbi:hypothetical protein PFISCL1PPCAC_9770, partial [Pristionchus fissidentatus]
VRWSLYDLTSSHDRIKFIPTAHRAGNMGYLRMFAHDLLPLYVEKVILLDTDTMVLEDLAVMHSYFAIMDRKGAIFGASGDMYKRYEIRTKLPRKKFGPNVGIVMLDIKRMRETPWNDLWKEETLRLIHKYGPPTASEQDTFASLEYSHPDLAFRLPCGYNYQLGEWAVDSLCSGGSQNYDRVKIAHWTEEEKWSSHKPSAQHFTKIYHCIQMLDWSLINGVEYEKSSAPPRTLIYMRDGTMP